MRSVLILLAAALVCCQEDLQVPVVPIPEEAVGGSTATPATDTDTPVAHHSIATHSCSREASREARLILGEYVFSLVDEYGYELPTECPWHSSRDLFLKQEQSKKEVRHNQWKCLLCSKVFKGESYIDSHLENRHAAELAQGGMGECLGDYCDMLGCESYMNREQRRCKPKDMERRKHTCRVVINQCFPPGGSGNALLLHDTLETKFCSKFTCDDTVDVGQEKTRPRAAEGRGWRRVYIVLMILGAVMLLMFYIGLYLYKREMSLVSDLRKLSNSRREARLKMLKEKNF